MGARSGRRYATGWSLRVRIIVVKLVRSIRFRWTVRSSRMTSGALVMIASPRRSMQWAATSSSGRGRLSTLSVTVRSSWSGTPSVVRVRSRLPGSRRRRSRRLVLCGASAGHRPEPDLRDEALRLLERHGLRAAWERYWLPLFGPDASAEVLEQGWRIAASQGVESIAAGVRAFHARPDREEFLGTWAGPVVLVSGEHDIRPERSQRLADQLPNGTSRLVAGAGHYLPLEAPSALEAITADTMASLA